MSVVCGPIIGFAYVANAAIAVGSVGLSSYAINGATGALATLFESSPRLENLAGIALTPNKQFLYVSSPIAGTVSGFVVNATTGGLSAVPGGPVTTGSSVSVAVDPVVNFSTSQFPTALRRTQLIQLRAHLPPSRGVRSLRGRDPSQSRSHRAGNFFTSQITARTPFGGTR